MNIILLRDLTQQKPSTISAMTPTEQRLRTVSPIAGVRVVAVGNVIQLSLPCGSRATYVQLAGHPEEADHKCLLVPGATLSHNANLAWLHFTPWSMSNIFNFCQLMHQQLHQRFPPVPGHFVTSHSSGGKLKDNQPMMLGMLLTHIHMQQLRPSKDKPPPHPFFHTHTHTHTHTVFLHCLSSFSYPRQMAESYRH